MKTEDQNNENEQLRQTPVSGSVFFKPNRYYKKKIAEERIPLDCQHYFKCEQIVNPERVSKDAFGIELVITPGKGMFHIHCTAKYIFSEYEEISKDEFLKATLSYTNQVALRFS